MDKKQKQAKADSMSKTAAGNTTDVRRLATKAVLSLPSSSEASFDAMLALEGPSLLLPKAQEDFIQQELAFARAFNLVLPDEPQQALQLLEETVCRVLNVKACYIAKDADLSPSLGEERPLLFDGHVIGRVHISEKATGEPLSYTDRVYFDLLLPYLATQAKSVQDRIQANQLSELETARQGRLALTLTLAEKLLTAIDAESILPIVLETAFRQLGFDACQYVALEGNDWEQEMASDVASEPVRRGELLYEIRTGGAQANRVHSYSHAGLEGRRRLIRGYGDMLDKIQPGKGMHACLQLPDGSAQTLLPGRLFGIRGIQSALVLPVIDLACGEMRGTLHFLSEQPGPFSEATLEAAADIARLASRAFSRGLILEKALEMASSDELTGLMNRRGYYQRFEAEIERARRHQIPLCVALLDVDHFKKFNDTYGHLSGDLILKTLSDLFGRNMRKSDVICRFGGEEFAILLPDTSLRAATDLIDRLRQSVANLEIPDFTGEKLKVTISAGLAEVSVKPTNGPHDADMSQALAAADEQLYRAKNNGRNRVCAPEKAASEKSAVVVPISTAS
jgi:diguanylate cyclase (GGDEF)-like protein